MMMMMMMTKKLSNPVPLNSWGKFPKNGLFQNGCRRNRAKLEVFSV